MFLYHSGCRFKRSAPFGFDAFKRLLIEFRQHNTATLEGQGGGGVTLKRMPEGKVEITIRAAYGDGCISIMDDAKPGTLIPLGIDLGGED